MTSVLAVALVFAAVHEFRSATDFRFRTEPAGFEKDVVVSQATDRVVIDASAAYAKGMDNLVCTSTPFEDASFGGDDVIFEATLGSTAPVDAMAYLQMGKDDEQGRRRFHVIRARTVRAVGTPEVPMRYVSVETCPERSGGYQLRFDFRRPARPAVFHVFGGRVARACDVRFTAKRKDVKPELIFHLPFDGSAEPAVARGAAKPVAARGLEYAPGVKGQALRVSDRLGSLAKYAFKDNVIPERGTISMWVKPEWTPTSKGRFLFAPDTPFGSRHGTGALFLWCWEGAVRLDSSDDCDHWVRSGLKADGVWHHLAATWNEAGVAVWVDAGGDAFDYAGGMGNVSIYDCARSPHEFRSWGKFDAHKAFSIGSQDGKGSFNGLIDEVKVFSAALDRAAIEKLYREGKPPPPARVDYAALSAARGANPYERAGAEETELVDAVTLDAAGVAALKAADRLSVVGESAFGTLEGRGYLQLGPLAEDRLAVRFPLDVTKPLHVVEIDYPDDALRTMDVIVQNEWNPFYGQKELQDCAMEVGVMTGGDYPLTRRMRTHRCVYWTGHTNAVVEVMTARDGCPAAVAAIRLYRVKAGALPPAAVSAPKPVAGWGRTMGWYFEDPSVPIEFNVPQYSATPELALEMVDKIAAVMKYQGLDLLAYPLVWYGGMIGENYNPCHHPPDFARAFYERFDREGLGFVAMINQHDKPMPPETLVYDAIADGSVHASAIGIRSTGRPGVGFVRTPSLYNICHPDTQAYYERMFDRILADGVSHPSFRGIGLHLKHSSMCWLGSLPGGYNDYMIDSFEKATGLKVPVDRADPLRGRKYAAWLKANAYEQWVQHRCDLVSGFWARMAAKLRAARPDLKLWFNDIADLDPIIDRFADPGYNRRMAREAGLDRELIAARAPNAVMSQTSLPADYRYCMKPDGYYPTQADLEHQRIAHTLPEYWDFLRGASYPAVNLHDRYWESHPGDVARNPRPERRHQVKWLLENRHRVTTINATEHHAMEHYAVPLRFADVLGFTKGGYLVGTYGMEKFLVPFARAFRALPAVTMDTLPGGGEFVRLRQKDYDGKSYFYVVNTGREPAEVTLRMPEGTADLVSGEKLGGKTALTLAPYSLRSFSAPSGRPAF